LSLIISLTAAQLTENNLELYRISAPAKPESGHFSEFRPSQSPAKFLDLPDFADAVRSVNYG